MGNLLARRQAAGDLASNGRFERVDAGWILERSAALCGGEDFGSSDSLSFGYVIQTIRLEILERIQLAARPADFEEIDFFGRANAEMYSQIVLRKIAAAAANLVDLLVRLSF